LYKILKESKYLTCREIKKRCQFTLAPLLGKERICVTLIYFNPCKGCCKKNTRDIMPHVTGITTRAEHTIVFVKGVADLHRTHMQGVTCSYLNRNIVKY
jgi:hypothetical protein